MRISVFFPTALVAAALFFADARFFLSADAASFNAKPGTFDVTLPSMAAQFGAPADAFKPHCWWHWMGTNISREGITKDLEAMRESGIAGAVIFNVGTFLPKGKDTRWPQRTYRSEEYWELFGHTLAEARRLGLKIGLHNCPGWSSNGGDWISEENSMQRITTSKLNVEISPGTASAPLDVALPEPPLTKRNSSWPRRATFTTDIGVFAMPARPDISRADIMDVTRFFNAKTSRLVWKNAPVGKWTIVRVAHGSTASYPAPVNHELQQTAFEADKFSREVNLLHWKNVLGPLEQRFGDYFGNTFTNVWVDSYEAGGQDWSPVLRGEFIKQRGYDPVPWIALQQAVGGNRDDVKLFNGDWRAVRNRLMIDNAWRVAKEQINAVGLDYYQEPYEGPFDTTETVSIPDIPVTEFWAHGDYHFIKMMERGMLAANKRIIAAEAFTTWPQNANFTEDPAFLKRTADGAYLRGANFYFLHSWVHQPYGDEVQPGLGLGPFGAHFGRHQTWFKQSHAFNTYLARCQMLLQQGNQVAFTREWNHRRTPEADIFFVVNNGKKAVQKEYIFPVGKRIAAPEIWDAYTGRIYTLQDGNTAAPQGQNVSAETKLTLNIPANGSLFIVFPNYKTPYAKQQNFVVKNEKATEVEGEWKVAFQPKLDKPFNRTFPELVDLSKQEEFALKYFSGTAVYRKTIRVSTPPREKFILDLGKLEDLAEVTLNGKNVGVLWHPPYRTDITRFLRDGDNTLEVTVAVNWANRIIGDEQFPPDYERIGDGHRGTPAMKQFPEWFLKNEPRPEPRRKTFTPVIHFSKTSKPYPAGLIGPVKIIRQSI
ncbi:MAG: hypothetical protein LBS59_07560 [Puniceicoccales bacterium]|jgi:hypothetical protein|nr:hypothetical protein [Puniceicoccales bacterium]